jgi:hypothetical protein
MERARSWRRISNSLENGERISLPDYGAAQILWDLTWEDINDAESGQIAALFQTVRGPAGSFLFIDPLVNLLGWSEDLSKSDWQTGQLRIVAGVADPQGGTRASRISNGTQGSQSLTQTIPVRGEYVACFSVWVRSNSVSVACLQRDGLQSLYAIGPAWKRIQVSGAGTAGQADSSFSMVLDAGQAIEAWGFQAEAQPAPSAYKVSSAATGIYPETRFASPQLTVTSTGPGLSACRLRLLSRVQE